MASNVLTMDTLMNLLPAEALETFESINETGDVLDKNTADIIATSIKSWALQNGATHFTHWFVPSYDSTAEKHLSFKNRSDKGEILDKFEGIDLIGTASSNITSVPISPRDTFEARGYARWDQNSPVFIWNKLLCIPTIYVSYNGNCLDLKTPLLKSIQKLKTSIIKFCNHFERDLTQVEPYIGWEQEFYLIPTHKLNTRLDLNIIKQTLYGEYTKPIEDGPSYFGRIPEVVLRLFRDLETQANELGIPLKTWHNESSPNQYEIASIHEKMNISIDHNLLLMDLLRLTARKYGLSANFHEKPFTGLSGSGKHCSWSILTPEGKNLISPGKTPRNSLRFSSLLLCAVKALKDNQELLSSLVSSHGNDQRLGKDDGPSLTNILFVGEFLSKFFLDVKAKMTNQKLTEKYKSELKNEFGKIPEILLNNKDSQRDAMIAFTGNKFEFRIIGASQNLSEFLIFWNVILSHEVLKFNDKIDDYMKNQNLKRDEAIFKTIELYIGYCEEVFKNNKGITQKDSSPLTLDKIEKLKETALNNQIFNSIEFDNWLNKKISNYYNSCLITYQTIHSFTQTTVIPGINEYLNKINDNLLKIKQIKSSHSKLLNQVEDFLKAQENVEIEIEKMANLKEKGNTTELILTITSKIQPQIEKCKHLLFNIDMCSTDEKWSIRNHNKILDIPSLQTNGMEFE